MRLLAGQVQHASRRRRPLIHNQVLLALVTLAWIGLGATGFISVAPNRLADGVSLPLWSAPVVPAAGLVAVLALLSLLSVAGERWADGAELALAIVFLMAVLLAAGLFAKAVVLPGHLAQRQALGPAFWVSGLIACLAILDAAQRLALGFPARAACLLLVVGLCVGLGATGVFDALSLKREFMAHKSVFGAALSRHVALVGASLALSLAVCAPLTLAVRRWPRAASPIYGGLSLVQTIPSIALFGLLISPLTALAAQVPWLKGVGISGLGATPALIALVLYAAFPLVRMSDAAFSAVEPAVADAARGLGFGPRRRFLAVDLPLALPVLLSGLRVVTLQAIGLATVAALIGGGGLGTFIFEGVGQYALDLVLIGAGPVILLALATDFGFRVLVAAVRSPA